jgi:hypothetical protein
MLLSPVFFRVLLVSGAALVTMFMFSKRLLVFTLFEFSPHNILWLTRYFFLQPVNIKFPPWELAVNWMRREHFDLRKELFK